MKRLPITVFLILLCITVNSSAQNFEGFAIYLSSRNTKTNLNKGDKNYEAQKEFQKQLAKSFQKEYRLTFTNNESLFKVMDKLEAPNPQSNGTVIKTSLGNELVYKNLKENRFTNQKELLGKVFLVKDSLAKKQWKILNETKTIGEYLCTKAVITKTYTSRKPNDDGTWETIEEEKDLVAWFTMQIPVNHGPGDYYGLPGLILEIEDGRLRFLCTKIVLNPQDGIEIIEPHKGKAVTQDEFDVIAKTKMKELRAQYKSRKRN